jgi:hypothetical protein
LGIGDVGYGNDKFQVLLLALLSVLVFFCFLTLSSAPKSNDIDASAVKIELPLLLPLLRLLLSEST